MSAPVAQSIGAGCVSALTSGPHRLPRFAEAPDSVAPDPFGTRCVPCRRCGGLSEPLEGVRGFVGSGPHGVMGCEELASNLCGAEGLADFDEDSQDQKVGMRAVEREQKTSWLG